MADGGADRHEELKDVRAERAVLASMLLDNDVFSTVCSVVSARDFWDPRHGVIFTAMLEARKAGPVDVITLAAELSRVERLNTVGGPQYLGELTDEIPTVAHCRAHAEIVSDMATRRRVVHAFMQGISRAGSMRAEELIAFSAKTLRESAPRSKSDPKSSDQVASALYDEKIKTITGEKETVSMGVPTDLPSLDGMLSLDPGRLYVIAARPAMGKSALASQIAHHIASLGRGTVVMFPLEMPATEVAHRDVAGRAGLNVRSAERGELDQLQINTYVAELNALTARKIIYDDAPRPTIERIESVCEGIAMSGPVALVVVDYLQLMEMPRAERHELALGIVTGRLKALSMSLGCPVIALSQLNRKCEERPDKRPMLADLRDSGSVEQDADGVVFIYRDEVYHRDTKAKGVAEILVAKQRNGPTGMVALRWRPEQVRFVDPESDAPVYSVGGYTMRGSRE